MLCFIGRVLMDHRNGLAGDATLTHAIGKAEREATVVMLHRRQANITSCEARTGQ
ncbi:hypothetical protein MES4922_10265 [Mesorhizobium ventifaucium]|uniref:Uncharacterized protein n=1 Tax=Mesorhizobium ventifaucium TaxID=666020 RepID=A0ABN8JB93_9HYPH|nr:hypothetical protein MES4922_10265 [Mesorhizobium ventifaucium]